jgi:di/tricarboxylate transporter
MLLLLAITIALFIWGKWSPDVVALLSMLSLFVAGILDLSETLSGFSNPTVVMIGALFVIGEGLSQTGWTAIAGNKFIELAGKSATRLLLIVTLGAGFLSGFVSNTGTVAALLPATISSAWRIGAYPSQILMPVAFGSNTGGLLTLTGTPPNIIVSNALEESGAAGFFFFEFALIGLPLLLTTLLYFYFVGKRVLPAHRTNNRPIDPSETVHNWISAYQIDEGYYRLRIRSQSPFINTRIGDWDLEGNFGVSVIRLRRRHPNPIIGKMTFIELPEPETVMEYHDIITVQGETEGINRMMLKFRLGLLPLEPIADEMRNNLINHEVGMAEIIINPKSALIGQSLFVGAFFKQYGTQLIAASRGNKPLKERPIQIKAGDAFLVRGPWENIGKLRDFHQNMVVCGSPEGMAKSVDRLNLKSYFALGALILMIFLMMFKVVPGAVAALIGAGVTILTGCVTVPQAYRSVSWVSVIMIAAMIPMGLALQKTGLAGMAADGLVASLGSIHPIVLLAGVFLLTTSFSQVINNSATAVLMAPIAIQAATNLGVSAEPFMIVVAVSASTAFLTPIGTTTNAMVLSAGGYSFMDYFKAGSLLLLAFLVITLSLVPLIWPF